MQLSICWDSDVSIGKFGVMLFSVEFDPPNS